MRNIGRRLREAKSARAFAFEVGVVVVGVLIALGAQELVSDWTWRNKAEEGRGRLKKELAVTATHAAEYIITAPCVQAQLKQLEANVLSSGSTLEPAPVIETRLGATALYRPNRPWSSQTWDALRQDGTANHLAFNEQLLLNRTYSQNEVISENTRISFGKAGVFRLMAYPIPLDAGTRATLLQEIAAQSYRTQFDLVALAQIIGNLRELGFAPSDAEIDAALDRLNRAQNSAIQYCRENDLPLADWRPVVEKYKLQPISAEP